MVAVYIAVGLVSVMTGAVLAYFLMKGRIDDTKKFYEENMETMRAQFKAAASEIAETIRRFSGKIRQCR